MLTRFALVLALVACSSRKAPTEVVTTRYPIVSDAMLAQLGDIGFALAVDVRKLDATAVDSLVPSSLGCARDILRAAKIAVVTKGPQTWEARITGIAEAPARTCATSIGNALAIAVTPADNHAITIDLPGTAAVVTWRGDEAVVAQQGAAVRSGSAPGVITDLLASVPRNVAGWVVTSGIPEHKIKSAVAWLEATPTTWTITVTAVASELGAGKPWIEGIVGGFTAAAQAAHIPVAESWFAVEATPATATLVATIPLTAFVPSR